MRKSHGKGGTQAAPRQEAVDVMGMFLFLLYLRSFYQLTSSTSSVLQLPQYCLTSV